MGLMTTLAIGELELTLEEQIGIHLRSNFYPPIPLSMVQPCVDAINAFWNDVPDAAIEMPSGVYYRSSNYAPAHAIIEQHRLGPWCEVIDWDDEYYEEEEGD